jgi:curved DNA-binding protein
MRDPYSVLGVDRNADQEAIRKAYKKLARSWHPDVNKTPGAEDRFKEINAAYDIVGDEEKRKNFDRFGEASTRSGFDPRQAGGGFDFGGGGVDVDDLLGSLFGNASRGPRRGQDQSIQISVPFMQTILGHKASVTLRRPDGRAETIEVPIPAGARDGGRIRLKGQGLPPRGGGPCGDLIVQLQVSPHPLLRRLDEADLELDIPLTVLEAMEGAAITVPTPTGDVKVKVPPSVKAGSRLRIKGRGVQRRGSPGDLFLILRPEVPSANTPEALAAARAIDAAYETSVRGALTL